MYAVLNSFSVKFLLICIFNISQKYKVHMFFLFWHLWVALTVKGLRKVINLSRSPTVPMIQVRRWHLCHSADVIFLLYALPPAARVARPHTIIIIHSRVYSQVNGLGLTHACPNLFLTNWNTVSTAYTAQSLIYDVLSTCRFEQCLTALLAGYNPYR